MKLDGLHVLDLPLFPPSPLAAMLMADRGTNVIAGEPPAGERVRQRNRARRFSRNAR